MRVMLLRVRGRKASLKCLDETDLLKYSTIAIMAGNIFHPAPCFAMTQADRTLAPVINIIRDFAKPICYGSMLWGWSKVMLGQRHEGYKQIRESIWGFLGVQFTPVIFDIIHQVGRGIS